MSFSTHHFYCYASHPFATPPVAESIDIHDLPSPDESHKAWAIFTSRVSKSPKIPDQYHKIAYAFDGGSTTGEDMKWAMNVSLEFIDMSRSSRWAKKGKVVERKRWATLITPCLLGYGVLGVWSSRPVGEFLRTCLGVGGRLSCRDRRGESLGYPCWGLREERLLSDFPWVVNIWSV